MFTDSAYNPTVHCLLSDYHVPGMMLTSLQAWSYFILKTTLESMYYDPPSSFETTEALRS